MSTSTPDGSTEEWTKTVGAVATLVTVAPLFLGTEPFPPVAYAVCMLMGVGFVIAAGGVLRSIAAQRRQAGSSRS
ncbi:hypothetical protein [Streptomyces sp. t39]|uniref:hypothetical protein n=1 Tax=Streptomyces sp. t39 TaxID=1828156 RepID=UPI0011CDF8C5|nr:hypothetical protein [Streptomyces sp. t39]TXS55706.1 hypothetical protein EAO77_05700 [Streptomyces sp. t39]